MNQPQLVLIRGNLFTPSLIPFAEKLADHQAILQGFLDTHITRNHSERTIQHESNFLKGWFEDQIVEDSSHPQGQRQLFIWEAMSPVTGRERIQAYSKMLLCEWDRVLKAQTVTTYLGSLRRLFEYILEFPYIPGTHGQSIIAKYGRLDQPVLEFDYPAHILDHETEDFALTGKRLNEFVEFVRRQYVGSLQKKLPALRDYAMIVIACTSGLRADEIRHLDALGSHRDLFYEENCLQTRYGKAAKGSGKRVRKTLFTKSAQAVLKVYEERVRPQFPRSQSNPALFLSEQGNRISYGAMQHNINQIAVAATRAGIHLPPSFGWHSLRKSFATEFMERSPEKMWTLMHWLGHLNPSTMYRYVIPSQEYYELALETYAQEWGP